MVPLDQFDIFNDTDDPLPAGGLCQWAGGVTSKGAVKVVKPTADSAPNLIVCGPHGIAPRSAGLGTFAPAVVVAFEPTAGTPAVGDALGSQVGSFLAKKGNTGFVCYAGAAGPWALCARSAAGGTIASGEAILSAAYDIAANNVWEDTGLSVTLPEYGTYLMICEAVAQGRVTTFSGGTDRAGVYAGLSYGTDMTTPVASSLAAMVRGTGTPSTFGRTSFGSVFTASAGTGLTVKLLCLRDIATTWAIARFDITTDGYTDGETRVKWVKLTNTPGGSGPPGEKGDPGDTGATGATGAAGADGATNPEAQNAVVGLQVFGP